MNSDVFFGRVKEIVGDFTQSASTKILAAQSLVDLLHEVDDRSRNGDLSKQIKNRYCVTILNHLSLLRETKHTPFYRRSRFSHIYESNCKLLLSGLDFSGLTMPDISFTEMILVACSFDEADLRSAKFSGSQLQGCSFQRTDLSNADFKHSILYGCNLDAANLRNVKGLNIL